MIPETYRAKCSRCHGTGIYDYIEHGYKVDKKDTCHQCNGLGYTERKKPKITKHGEVERPKFELTDYEIKYKQNTNKDAPSTMRNYFKFRVELKRYLLSHRGNKCEICGINYRTQRQAYHNLFVHHIVMKKDGGSDEDDNLILLCLNCHQNQHNFTISIPVIEGMED